MEILIDTLVSDGRGLGRQDGRVFFVRGAVPGEVVVARVTRLYPGYVEAVSEQVLEPSPDRREPFCPYFGRCGGCSLQYIAPQAQFQYKIAAFCESLHRIGKLTDDRLPDHVDQFSGPDREYRNRMRFVASREGEFSQRAALSDELLPLNDCPVAHGAIRRCISARELPVGTRPCDEFTVYADDSGIWAGEETAAVQVDDLVFRFPVAAFFQSNRSVLESALPYITGHLPDGAIADLYGGVGLLGAFCARDGHEVISVDSSSAPRTAIPGMVFRQQTVERWIRSPEARKPYGTVLLDPPRGGLSKPVRRYLAAARVKEIRYLSCNPDSFARDAGQLVQSGFSVDRLAALDFYPHTNHLEVYGVFRRE